VAGSSTPVLLVGESGTGKELFARFIHALSPRKNEPFVVINCADSPAKFLEIELFGHERGAFTGATSRNKGKFDLANKGTVYLDNIGYMSKPGFLDLGLQARFLRVMEEGRFLRFGGVSEVKTDVRFLASTTKDLKEAVEGEQFLENLYARLNAFPIYLPPLCDRKEDIPLLANRFLAEYCGEIKKDTLRFSPEAVEAMMNHSWPGNIDELQGCIQRALALCDGVTIKPEHLELHPSVKRQDDEQGDILSGSLYEEAHNAVREVESRMIKRVLRETGGNKSRAAEILKVSYKTLLTKIKEYDLEQT
jgi:DNA-binding NtrC family response regulator